MSDPQSPHDSQSKRERLDRLRRLGLRRGRAGFREKGPRQQAPTASPAKPPAGAARSGIVQVDEPIEHLVGGQVVNTPHGPCLVVERRYPLAETRGGWMLGQVLALSGPAVAACARDADLTPFDFRRAAFIDSETTGLTGGAGTVAFQVGIGLFEPDSDGHLSYLVRQVFMRNPTEERALLHLVEASLAGCTGLVSFNGRAFDAPLLESRFIMHHLPSPLAGLHHLDLLPPARRRWRGRLASCSLGSLENHILNHRRQAEDTPGWLIPSLYQNYARGLGSGPMAGVFYHNQEDIISMAPLAAILCAPFEAQGAGLAGQSLHPADVASLGRSFEELGWLAAGESAYRQALDLDLPDATRAWTLNRLGWLLKRQERRDEAAAVWQDWITSIPGPNPTPYVELAKHHEWWDTDLAAARKWTLWGMHTARQMPPGPAREQAIEDLQHRLERLEKKIG